MIVRNLLGLFQILAHIGKYIRKILKGLKWCYRNFLFQIAIHNLPHLVFYIYFIECPTV